MLTNGQKDEMLICGHTTEREVTTSALLWTQMMGGEKLLSPKQ